MIELILHLNILSKVRVISTKIIYTRILFIIARKKMETTQMSISKGVDKQTVICHTMDPSHSWISRTLLWPDKNSTSCEIPRIRSSKANASMGDRNQNHECIWQGRGYLVRPQGPPRATETVHAFIWLLVTGTYTHKNSLSYVLQTCMLYFMLNLKNKKYFKQKLSEMHLSCKWLYFTYNILSLNK